MLAKSVGRRQDQFKQAKSLLNMVSEQGNWQEQKKMNGKIKFLLKHESLHMQLDYPLLLKAVE